MTNSTSGTATIGDFPWQPSTAPATPDPWQPTVTPNVGGAYTWPAPPVHPAELEAFEEFVIWACGFTDPEHPPSQKKWEEFQKKVMQLAADFVEYKRAKREAERFGSQPFTTSSATLKIDNSKITQEQIDALLTASAGSTTTVTSL